MCICNSAFLSPFDSITREIIAQASSSLPSLAITTTTASLSRFIAMVLPSFSTASYTAPKPYFLDIFANAHIKSSSSSCCLQ
ncbi:hypothetical protein ACFX11_041399 [Malus domestica]